MGTPLQKRNSPPGNKKKRLFSPPLFISHIHSAAEAVKRKSAASGRQKRREISRWDVSGRVKEKKKGKSVFFLAPLTFFCPSYRKGIWWRLGIKVGKKSLGLYVHGGALEYIGTSRGFQNSQFVFQNILFHFPEGNPEWQLWLCGLCSDEVTPTPPCLSCGRGAKKSNPPRLKGVGLISYTQREAKAKKTEMRKKSSLPLRRECSPSPFKSLYVTRFWKGTGKEVFQCILTRFLLGE